MKRISLVFFSLCLSFGLMPMSASAAPDWPSGVSVQAEGAVLMDADTGTILYGKNIDQGYYPASITKMLTALIVLEQCDLDEIVEFSHDDVYNVEEGSSSAGIDEGDKLTVRDCLYALMLASANESANALACHISGSREAFAELMNQKAASLGCTGSHFTNPSGLNDENHYTTAHDMALIAREVIKIPAFLEINSARSYQLAPTKRSPEGGYVANHHKMLNKNESVYYPGAFAGKTGYTSLAGNTLVTCAKNQDMTLIAVVLNCPQSHYEDTKNLFNFGFRNFQSIKAVDYEVSYKSVENDMTIGGMTAKDNISLELDQNGRIVIPKEASFSDTVPSLTYELGGSDPHDAIACIQYTYFDRIVGNVYLRYAGSPGSLGQSSDSASDTVLAEKPDSTGNQETLAASVPSSEDISAESAPVENIASDPDFTSEPGAATSIRIPANLYAVLGIAASLSAIVAVIIAIRIHVRRKEENAMLIRRQRRLERLEDIGCSSEDFDRLVSQKRSTSSSSYSRRRSRRRRL